MQKGQPSAHLRAGHVGVRRPREPIRTPTEKANDSKKDMGWAAATSKCSSVADVERMDFWNMPAEAR